MSPLTQGLDDRSACDLLLIGMHIENGFLMLHYQMASDSPGVSTSNYKMSKLPLQAGKRLDLRA